MAGNVLSVYREVGVRLQGIQFVLSSFVYVASLLTSKQARMSTNLQQLASAITFSHVSTFTVAI